MSVSFKKESEDLFVISIEGVLTFIDLKELEKKVIMEIDHSQKVNLLLLAAYFAGWGKEGDWGDLSFMYEHDAYMKKIAVVTNEKRKDEISIFLGAGMRKAAVEFFFPGESKSVFPQLIHLQG